MEILALAVEIWSDLDGFVSRERSLVESVGLGFSCKEPPTANQPAEFGF